MNGSGDQLWKSDGFQIREMLRQTNACDYISQHKSIGGCLITTSLHVIVEKLHRLHFSFFAYVCAFLGGADGKCVCWEMIQLN